MRHHLDSTKRKMLGKTLESLTRRSDCEVDIRFTDGTAWTVSVEGDCCSYSVFYAIDPGDAIGGELLDIVEGGYPESLLSATTADDEETALKRVRQENISVSQFENPYCLSIWNVVLRTTTGMALIRHINDSNGYYDGLTGYREIS
jgi:hypothetical protein